MPPRAVKFMASFCKTIRLHSIVTVKVTSTKIKEIYVIPAEGLPSPPPVGYDLIPITFSVSMHCRGGLKTVYKSRFP
jgi:hypothetical protein